MTTAITIPLDRANIHQLSHTTSVCSDDKKIDRLLEGDGNCAETLMTTQCPSFSDKIEYSSRIQSILNRYLL